MAGAGTLSEPAVSRPRSEGLCKQEVWALWVRELLLGWATLLEKEEGHTRRWMIDVIVKKKKNQNWAVLMLSLKMFKVFLFSVFRKC